MVAALRVLLSPSLMRGGEDEAAEPEGARRFANMRSAKVSSGREKGRNDSAKGELSSEFSSERESSW